MMSVRSWRDKVLNNDTLQKRTTDMLWQAAACDGTDITTTVRDEEIIPGVGARH